MNLARRGVLGEVYTFDTGEDSSFESGRIPAHPCLQPSLNGRLAAISPACRAQLTAVRTSLQPGAGAEFVNDEPWVDGDREMGYLWWYSLGVKREIMPNLGVSIDYVGNRGRNQTTQIDISEGPPGPNGRITRLTADQFDPDGTIVPPVARDVEFGRVLEYQTLARARQRLRLARVRSRKAVRRSVERPRGVHDRQVQRRRAAGPGARCAGLERSRIRGWITAVRTPTTGTPS